MKAKYESRKMVGIQRERHWDPHQQDLRHANRFNILATVKRLQVDKQPLSFTQEKNMSELTKHELLGSRDEKT